MGLSGPLFVFAAVASFLVQGLPPLETNSWQKKMSITAPAEWHLCKCQKNAGHPLGRFYLHQLQEARERGEQRRLGALPQEDTFGQEVQGLSYAEKPHQPCDDQARQLGPGLDKGDGGAKAGVLQEV